MSSNRSHNYVTRLGDRAKIKARSRSIRDQSGPSTSGSLSNANPTPPSLPLLPPVDSRPIWHRGNSIEQLTTVFVTGLQENFPSTVPNIVRTSGKLGQEDGSRERGQCALCQSSLDTSVGEASALRAVEISEHLSEGATVSDAETVCLESDRSVPGDVRGSLCYGCRLMIKGLKDISFLPPRVKSAALSRDEMRSQIAEYLLEEGSET